MHSSRSINIGAFLASFNLMGCAPGGTQRPVSLETGKQIAADWCSECRRIAPDQPSGMRRDHVLPPPVEAPSFMQIAAKPYIDQAYLHGFVTELHPSMPTFRLSPEEQQDVIAYILSLRSGP